MIVFLMKTKYIMLKVKELKISIIKARLKHALISLSLLLILPAVRASVAGGFTTDRWGYYCGLYWVYFAVAFAVVGSFQLLSPVLRQANNKLLRSIYVSIVLIVPIEFGFTELYSDTYATIGRYLNDDIFLN